MTTVGIVSDPLGAFEAAADFRNLQRWTTTEVPDYDIMVDDPSNMKVSPFAWDDALNRKMILW